ncbi:hypothetical protein R6Q59_003221 [Mikania micrantha]
MKGITWEGNSCSLLMCPLFIHMRHQRLSVKPSVSLLMQVYHPNIDLEGNICLNILREDWKPVLNINTIVYGLYHLLTEPNHDDPLNQEAAAVLRDNPKAYSSNVRTAMAGGRVGDTYFARCI